MTQQAKHTDVFEQVLLSYAEMCYSVALALTRDSRQAQELATRALTWAWHRRDSADAARDIKKTLLKALREQFLQHYASFRTVSGTRLLIRKGHTMYCPRCGGEYRDDFTRCSDCDEALVSELPAERTPEYENLVTIFEGDAGSAAVARATVENAGVESWIKDEEVHGLFPGLGSTEILVRAEDQQQAHNALETRNH